MQWSILYQNFVVIELSTNELEEEIIKQAGRAGISVIIKYSSSLTGCDLSSPLPQRAENLNKQLDHPGPNMFRYHCRGVRKCDLLAQTEFL